MCLRLFKKKKVVSFAADWVGCRPQDFRGRPELISAVLALAEDPVFAEKRNLIVAGTSKKSEPTVPLLSFKSITSPDASSVVVMANLSQSAMFDKKKVLAFSRWDSAVTRKKTKMFPETIF